MTYIIISNIWNLLFFVPILSFIYLFFRLQNVKKSKKRKEIKTKIAGINMLMIIPNFFLALTYEFFSVNENNDILERIIYILMQNKDLSFTIIFILPLISLLIIPFNNKERENEKHEEENKEEENNEEKK